MLRKFKAKIVFRVVLAFLLVASVATSLLFISPLPVKALNIAITNTSGNSLAAGTLGLTYNFRVTVSIEDSELLPIQSISLKIYNQSFPTQYYDQYTGLSLQAQGLTSYPTSGTGTAAAIEAIPSSTWGYFTTGAGYVYWENQGYSFTPIVGGYGYNDGTGTASITYLVSWTPPSSWAAGTYKIETRITAGSHTFTRVSAGFTLDAPSSGFGGVPPVVIVPSPGVTDVSRVVASSGVFTEDVTAQSGDGKVKLTIDRTTVGRTGDGSAITSITIAEIKPPAQPDNASIIGLTYEIGPDGATFEPAITLTFSYDPAKLPEGSDETKLSIAVWDKAGARWVSLSGGVVNKANHTVSVKVGHFSTYTVIAPAVPEPVKEVPTVEKETPTEIKEVPTAEKETPTAAEQLPAAFTTSELKVLRSEVNVGESVLISVRVTNTGELSGNYAVTLKINNAVAETKDVTLAGGTSQTVTFTTSQDNPGTYTVTVDDLSTEFTVKGAAEEGKQPVKPNPIVYLIIGLGVAFTIGIAAWFVMRRRAA